MSKTDKAFVAAVEAHSVQSQYMPIKAGKRCFLVMRSGNGVQIVCAKYGTVRQLTVEQFNQLFQ